jgi:two-component system LytT family response regulator
MLNILIADDESIARQTLEIMLLENMSNIAIKQAKDGQHAIELLAAHQFDIVFLDIQMPSKTGLEVAKHVPKHSAIVFVTAYDEFAIDAFTVNAIDYLLKPLEDDRFSQALDKAKQYHQASEDVQKQKQEDVQQTVTTILNKNKKLVLKEVGKIKLIDQQDIKYIAGAGNYVEIHLLNDKTLVQRETLASIEKKLDSALFSRIHKSTIIRNELVIELRPTQKGDYIVKLRSGEEVMLSRRNKDKLDSIFS